jgi:hypothetical protein
MEGLDEKAEEGTRLARGLAPAGASRLGKSQGDEQQCVHGILFF